MYDLQLFGIKVGLRNIQSLVQFLGFPHLHYPTIHIAGTNGKGSIAAMISSILTASGYRTGLYTSPHLVRFNERIRINGQQISDDDIVGYTALLRPQIVKMQATFFEATTAIAFRYFADRQVDFAVIETGLGGRLDATNVVVPALSIITNIGIDHTEYLGKTYKKIAYEKGGIIKQGVPCLTGTNNPSALNMLRQIAREKKARLIQSNKYSSIAILKSSLDGTHINLNTASNVYKDLVVPLAGDHQATNLQVAINAVEFLKESRNATNVTKKSIIAGLNRIVHNTGWRGRIDVLRKNPLIVADVAHNPDGVSALVSSLRKLLGGRVVLVFGVMKDKDYRSMFSTLLPLARMTVAVQPKTPRALESKLIVQELHTHGSKALNGGSVRSGMEIARKEARRDEVILVTGSHYVVGDAMKVLKISA